MELEVDYRLASEYNVAGGGRSKLFEASITLSVVLDSLFKVSRACLFYPNFVSQAGLI